MDSSEKAKGKEKVETTEASETIIAVEGEDNFRAAGGLSPGDIGAYGSRMDEATDVGAKKRQDKIRVIVQKPHNYTASKSTSTAPASAEDNSRAAGDLYPGHIQGTDFDALIMLGEIEQALQKPPSYTASESISTAPASTEDRDKKLYEPRAVAIGPCHRKTENNYFRITDKHKLWCVKQEIGDNYERDLGKFLRKMEERKEDAMNFYRGRYGENNFSMDSHSFLKMLTLDSCFILFALSINYDLAKEGPMLVGSKAQPWASHDIVRALELVKTDLLLLNNQIPFFILEDVFKMKNDICPKEKKQNGGNEGNGSIRKYALEFFDFPDLGRNSSKDPENGEVDHLLHLYHMYLEPPLHPGRSCLGDILPPIDPQRSLPSATELQRKSAVNFKVKEMEPEIVLDVTMRKSGDIQMPALRVEDHTNILLHNLISFEQPLGTLDSYVTAYVAFLDHIVQREEDVELLENSGVLEHRLTSSSEVVALFRQLHYVIDHYKTPGYLAKVYQEVNGCCNSKWRQMYADAKQRYCSNVWLSISFVAGIALSVLTLIETIYAIIGFYQS
ncbi:UPF0481 protein At3g47200-like isoform X2 [Phoenix dactylifera]|uniref:UPF0481 protein At3g47200-like isoform X2 n=1 Tax=Phoenix dactylifera TaxID=42345 RepID=A0A8B8ZN46_PHODC|nr:UPF0481 protein At3g47200-like isoform X2 [Phoenix dactylifera]